MIRLLRLLLPIGLAAGLSIAAFAQTPSNPPSPKPAATSAQPAPQQSVASTPAASTARPASSTQQAPPPSETQEQLTESVDALAAKLKDVESRLDAAHPTPAQLTTLSTDVTPLVTDADAMVERLTPRAAAMKARVDQLGPKPDKGPPESADVVKERASLQKAFDDDDGLLKRAKVLALKAQQYGTYIGKRQRQLFTHSLFKRSTSLLDPPLWLTVVHETPGNLSDMARRFNDWIGAFNRTLSGGRLVVFWSLVTLVVALYWPLTRLAKYLARRQWAVGAPGEWQKVMVACWTSVSTAVLVIAVTYAVAYVFSFFTTPDPSLMPLFLAMQAAVIRIAIAAGLARGLLAPNHPKWRLVNLDEVTSDKLIRIVMGVALIVAVGKVIEALNDAIGASLEFTVAARGLGALLVAVALAAALIDLGDDPETDNPDGDVSSPAQRRDLYGLIRGLVWALIVVITVAVLIGYIPLASFLVEQVTLVAATGAALYLLVRLADEACEYGFQPGAVVGRTLIHTVGMRRETLGQLAVLVSGAVRLALFLVALIVIAAPWGMQSTDVSGNLHAIFFGFRVGDVTVSLAGIVVAIVSFLVVLAITRGLQNWLEDRYLPQTRLDSGLRNSIKTSLGYVGFILAVSLAAANLGVDFQKLAIVAGALSVGIGFGLQSIVNNVVSGLILLWERAVRVGDLVIVGSDQGYVRKINVRSTEIETFDRAAVIVPNSNLVSGVVKNLMRTDRVGRLTIDVTVNAAADPEKVREVLLDIARGDEAVLSLPAPQVRFVDLTASTMTFALFCFVADVETTLRTKSDLYFEICRQFRQAHFFDGPPADPTRISLTGLDRLEAIPEAGQKAGADPVRSRKTG